MLRACGYTLEEIVREVKGDKRVKGTKYGRPYFALADRVTFPLILEGFVTNFYGRATWSSKKFKHTKLSIQDGAYCHGGFNMQVLNEDCEEVIAAESVIDALSLIQSGHKSVIAFLSVTNYAVLESVMGAQKPLALALNNDKAGKEAAERMMKYFGDMEYEFPIRNFSEQFFAEHGDSGGLITDYNEWWKLRQNSADSIT